MRLIGKMDDKPVYEFDRGQYVIVDPETERWMVTWAWFGNFGRNFDMFEKCTECEEDEKCISVIDKNKEDILKQLNAVADNIDSDIGKELLKEQEEFYEALEDGREYDYYDGYTDEIEEE